MKIFIAIFSLVLISSTVNAAAAKKDLNLPYAKIFECRMSQDCSNNSICQIEVSISMADWLNNKSSARGLVTWFQGIYDPKNWVYADKLSIFAKIDRVGNNYTVTPIVDLFPAGTLTINGLNVGQQGPGVLTYSANKKFVYQCQRYKDPK